MDSSGDRHEKNSRPHEQDLPVIELANDDFMKGLDYWTYLLADKSFCYDDEVAGSFAKRGKRLQVRMK